jgi:hypothetical protein
VPSVPTDAEVSDPACSLSSVLSFFIRQISQILIGHGPTQTDTDNFLGSNSPQLTAEYNRHNSYSPIPRQLCCGEPSFYSQKDLRPSSSSNKLANEPLRAMGRFSGRNSVGRNSAPVQRFAPPVKSSGLDPGPQAFIT